MLFSNHVRVSGTKCHPKALWYTSPPFCVSNRIDCCALPDAELLPSDNPVRIFSLLQTTDTSHCRTHLCSPTCRARPHFQMRCRIHEYALHAPLPPYSVSVVCKIIESIHHLILMFPMIQPFLTPSYSKTALGLSETSRFSCFQVRCKCQISEHKTHRLCLSTGRESLSDVHNYLRRR